MKKFMDDDFLLGTETAKKLYLNFAEKAPIIDYHCHIEPREIADNKQYENIAQMWLAGDHYKWRLMRSNGIDEYYITGPADDFEKFQKYAETLEKAIGNPLYHWSHLELKKYFGYHGVLNGQTASTVWNHCNQMIHDQKLNARSIIAASNVDIICTTDDPADDLKDHDRMAQDGSLSAQVFPAWRPDKILSIEKPGFSNYIRKLESAGGMEIRDFKALLHAIQNRMDYFHQRGCKTSDHGLAQMDFSPASMEETEQIFSKGLRGQTLTDAELSKYRTELLLFFGREYEKRDWVMQLHLGAQRDNNTRMFDLLGPDTGFDCIGPAVRLDHLARFLNELETSGALPKTIIYSLNPNDNAAIGTIIGCFQGGSVPGKLQHGSAWWFNDHIEGMKAQLLSLANLGLLGNFIGMTTDSRSILSYVRHDYFRRILCDILGRWVEEGKYPEDMASLGRMVENISFGNSRNYFGFNK